MVIHTKHDGRGPSTVSWGSGSGPGRTLGDAVWGGRPADGGGFPGHIAAHGLNEPLRHGLQNGVQQHLLALQKLDLDGAVSPASQHNAAEVLSAAAQLAELDFDDTRVSRRRSILRGNIDTLQKDCRSPNEEPVASVLYHARKICEAYDNTTI